MKVRITEPGWETFTGQFAEVEFADGVSTVELSGFQIARLGASVRLESLDGLQQSPSADLVRHAEMNADDAAGFDAVNLEVAPGKELKKIYTRAELEEVADKEGIAGLRLIGDTHGIKSRKIVELMELILKAQSGDEKPAEEPKVEAPVEETKAKEPVEEVKSDETAKEGEAEPEADTPAPEGEQSQPEGESQAEQTDTGSQEG